VVLSLACEAGLHPAHRERHLCTRCAQQQPYTVLQAKAYVATFCEPDLYLAVRTVVITIILYVGFFAAFPLIVKHWALWAVAICLRAGLNVRVFVIFHDCCNGGLLRIFLAASKTDSPYRVKACAFLESTATATESLIIFSKCSNSRIL
jgi:hypothetical protein